METCDDLNLKAQLEREHNELLGNKHNLENATSNIQLEYDEKLSNFDKTSTAIADYRKRFSEKVILNRTLIVNIG